MEERSRPQPPQPPMGSLGLQSTASSTNNPVAARASPFASGPVATVNQVRPSFGAPGQFPGHAVCAAPTQLSTPLVPQRSLTTPGSTSASDPTASSLFQERLAPIGGDTRSRSTSDLFGQAARPPPLFQPPAQEHEQQQQQPYQAPADLFGSPGSVPPFQVQASQDQLDRSPAESLFGAPSAPRAPGRVSQRQPYNSLFGSPEQEATPPGSNNSNRATELRRMSASSFSQGDTPPQSSGAVQSSSQPKPLLHRQYNQYQQQQQQRSFGQAPPPAAPFLGYGDGARSQSYRAPSASMTPTSVAADQRAGFSPARSAPPTAPPTAPSPKQSSSNITIAAASSDELLEEFLRMPIDERFVAAQQATPPTSKLLLADVPDTVAALEMLYMQKRWKSLTKKALSMLQIPSSDPNVTLEIKSWWLAGLIKEGQYDNAASVLDQMGDLDAMVFSGGNAFVFIRLRLLEALLSKCKGQTATHEKLLFHLLTRLRGALERNETMAQWGVEPEAAARWLRITQFALVNHLVQQQKFALALRVCSKIDVEALPTEEKAIVLSRVGRVRLQMGDLTTAEKLFEAARAQTNKLKGHVLPDDKAKVVDELEARLLLNDGLLLFAQNKLQEALSAFDSILYLPHTQTAAVDGSDEQLFLEEDLVCTAVNNYAICALYCCDVKAAVAALERMIRANPLRFLSGVVVFNLSSLYDLIYDNATSKSRKEMMKKIAHLYDLEHVDPAAYRI